MLSFQRDESSLTSQGGLPQNNANNGNGSNGNDQQYLTVASRGKNVRNSTVVLIIFFICGIIGLWFMARQTAVSSASAETLDAEETKIEKAIAKLTGVSSEMLRHMDEIVKKFYEFSDVPQVQVAELQKNPFCFELFQAAGKTKEGKAKAKLDKNAAEKLRLRKLKQQLQKKVSRMLLLSIIRSDKGSCCMITSNKRDKVLYKGDVVDEFIVREIGDGFVKLQWNQADKQKSQIGDKPSTTSQTGQQDIQKTVETEDYCFTLKLSSAQRQ